ncbi:MAG: hypothetical protein L0387_27050 [Acidobacteria bacterium]|nr:hypothetical protein [Acidobacteriota bacterium]
MSKSAAGENMFDSGHPSFEQLLECADGECSPALCQKISAHLEACLPCSKQYQKIKLAEAQFLATRAEPLGDTPRYPVSAYGEFEQKLDRREVANRRQVRLPALLGLLTLRQASAQLPLQWVFSGVVVLLVVVLVIRFHAVPPVSAHEILQRSKAAEQRRIAAVPGPVVYEKLRIQHLSLQHTVQESVTVETWNDTRNRRFTQRIQHSGGSAVLLSGDRVIQSEGPSAQASRPDWIVVLDQVLLTNRMDRLRPMSPAGYQAWRQSLSTADESVSKTQLPDGSEAMKLRTSATAKEKGRVVEAELTVRVQDWHPVEQHLLVYDESGGSSYRFVELDSQVLALNSLNADVLAELEPPARPSSPPEQPVLAGKTIFSAESWSAEIEVHFALHQINACLGDPVTVSRNRAGQILVAGLAETSQRKQELLLALQPIADLTVNIRTLDEAATASAPAGQERIPKTARKGVADRPDIQLEASSPPIRAHLEQYFREAGENAGKPNSVGLGVRQSQSARINDFSDQVILSSQKALTEVWALRRLAQRSAAESGEPLKAESRKHLEVMVREHLEDLTSALKRTAFLLSPVLSSLIGEASAGASGHQRADVDRTQATTNSDWETKTSELFRVVQQIDADVLKLFGDESSPEEQIGAPAARILRNLQESTVHFRAVESALERDFRTDRERAGARITNP